MLTIIINDPVRICLLFGDTGYLAARQMQCRVPVCVLYCEVCFSAAHQHLCNTNGKGYVSKVKQCDAVNSACECPMALPTHCVGLSV